MARANREIPRQTLVEDGFVQTPGDEEALDQAQDEVFPGDDNT